MSIIGKLSIAVVSTACIAFLTTGAAGAETLTFDELGSPTPADDLTVKGVTFDFKINGVDSTDAIYNLSLPPGCSRKLICEYSSSTSGRKCERYPNT